jgi:hypothetical protein
VCLGQEFKLGDPREVPDKIQNALVQCELRVPSLADYLHVNPAIRERRHMGS